MKEDNSKYMTRQLKKGFRGSAAMNCRVAVCVTAAVLSMSIAACNRKESVDNAHESAKAGSSVDSDKTDLSETGFDPEAIMEKLGQGVSSSLSVEYSYEKHTGGLTNHGSAVYDLAFAQSAEGVHMAGTLETEENGEESQCPVDIYVSLQAGGKVQEGQSSVEPGGAEQTDTDRNGTDRNGTGQPAAKHQSEGQSADKEADIEQKAGAQLYTLEEGGTAWSFEEFGSDESDMKTAFWYGLTGLFTADADWRISDDELELDGIKVMEASASLHGNDALRLLAAFPGDNSTEELLTALSAADAAVSSRVSAAVTAYVNVEKNDELAGLAWDFGDTLNTAFEGTALEGTSFMARADYRAFAYGDVDVSVPEAVEADAHSLDGAGVVGASETEAGSHSDTGSNQVTGGDGMSDTEDYEKKASDVQASGAFILSSSSCEAKVSVKNPEGLECAFASDESVHFSESSLLTTLNYGLYPEQYYSADVIADMVAEWVDYLKESQIYSNIKMGDVSKITHEGRDFSFRTVSFDTTETSASSLYAWCHVEPDAWLVIQLQEMGAEGELDAGKVLDSYAVEIKD